MRLAAQRNISIELFEADRDDMIVAGTLLDHEHLIKMEMNIYLPDEQITRCRVEMIRAPFPVCGEIEKLADRLVGLRIERGVLNELNRRVGGHAGCSHVKELATNMFYFVGSFLVKRRSGVDPLGLDFAAKPPEERFNLTKNLLRDSCLSYSQTTARGLDEKIGIRRVGEEHTHPIPLGKYERSLGVLLRDRAERHEDKVYLRYRQGDKTCALSFKEFADRTLQIGRHLMASGIRRGDRVGIISENRAEMFMAELAIMSVGAASVPVFAGYHPTQVGYVLRNARPQCVIVSGLHQLEKIRRSDFPSVDRFYSMDFCAKCKKWGASDFAELLEPGGASDRELDDRIRAVAPDDLCLIMYTSGTTGPPKGVKLSHGNLISQQKAISLMWDLDDRDVFLSYLPWHHSFGGLFERFMSLYQGCELCIDDSRGRDIDRLIENWKAFDPSLFFSVPRVHDQLVTRCRESSEVKDLVFGRRLRFVFTAGASLPAHVEADYQTHKIPVLEGWGLTETSPCVTATTKDRTWQSGLVGFPIPGVTLRIDSDQEILVKGPNVMSGYFDDEDATSRVLDGVGWFRTGDLGEFTRDGLRILGRKDGAFKLTTGEKVHPQRVETVLVNESPYISLALAVGSGRDFVGCLIYPDFARLGVWADEHGVSKDDLCHEPAVYRLFAQELERINPRIELKFQRVRRAAFLDHEPTLAIGELTPSGKIVRAAVLEHHKDKVDVLFAPKASPRVIDVQPPELQKV